MVRGRILATVFGLGVADGALMAAALATSRPVYYLTVAMAVGTLINLTYVLAARLWQVRP